jgi:putative (di)nucleoside polyphosphate hydrolase
MTDRSALPYRANVGAVLFDRRGKVLVARRADLPRELADATGWQLPQGGIDDGEDPRAAVLRELEEEIGTRHAAIIAEHDAWLTYDFPPELAALGGRKARYRGQRQRWFALRFLGTDADIRLDADPHPEFDAWRWTDLSDLPALAVSWKRPVYERLAEAFAAHAVPADSLPDGALPKGALPKGALPEGGPA